MGDESLDDGYALGGYSDVDESNNRSSRGALRQQVYTAETLDGPTYFYATDTKHAHKLAYTNGWSAEKHLDLNKVPVAYMALFQAAANTHTLGSHAEYILATSSKEATQLAQQIHVNTQSLHLYALIGVQRKQNAYLCHCGNNHPTSGTTAALYRHGQPWPIIVRATSKKEATTFLASRGYRCDRIQSQFDLTLESIRLLVRMPFHT